MSTSSAAVTTIGGFERDALRAGCALGNSARIFGESRKMIFLVGLRGLDAAPPAVGGAGVDDCEGVDIVMDEAVAASMRLTLCCYRRGEVVW